MFPGVDGFHWSAGHIAFIALFLAVALTIGATVATAVLRSVRDFRARRTGSICWKIEFEELPGAERRCRHEVAGRVKDRICQNAFDCGNCRDFARLAELPAHAVQVPLGLSLPQDRLYHRGHTWVRNEEDGTVTVGLDDLAQRMIGEPESVELPAPGAEIERDGPAWQLRKRGRLIRVRAPIAGTVVDRGGPQNEWSLKLRPRDSTDIRHLLRGVEVSAWMSRELERLQLELSQPGTAPALADGGVLVRGLMDAVPDADWDTVLAATFLEP
jgi:glycine cleavage system H protein